MVDFNKIVLIEHIQVLDEPLVSIYYDAKDTYFVSVKLYDKNNADAFLFLEVKPQKVLEYMEKEMDFKELIKDSEECYYIEDVSSKKIKSIDVEKANELLDYMGSIEGHFNDDLSYRSVGIKMFLKNNLK